MKGGRFALLGLACGLAGALIAPAAQGPSAPKLADVSSAASPRATERLFDDPAFAAWEYVAGTPDDVARVASLREGVVTIAGKPNGYIATRAAYRDYVLHFEWRWAGPDVPANANGGALVHVVSGPVQQKLWPTSFQVQLKNQRAGDILAMGSARFAETPTTPGTEASPSATLARRGDPHERSIGEWNAADIVVKNDTIAVTVNGVPQNEITGCVPAAGRIGFQLEGQPFELRNVTLGPLPSVREPARD